MFEEFLQNVHQVFIGNGNHPTENLKIQDILDDKQLILKATQ